MDDQKLDELLKSDAPNKPVKTPKLTAPEKPRFVPVIERRRRREALSRLLASGMSNDAIFELMGKEVNDDGSPGFNMTEDSVKHLISEVYAEWQEEDAERKPQTKAAAERRILRHIVQAKRDKAWTAVSTLEKVLMQIQGTAEPIEFSSTTDSRINEAILHILGEEDPRKIRELIESERVTLKGESDKPIAVLPDGNEVYDK